MKGYWADHRYFRLNVKDYVESFAGWKPLKELVSYAGNERNRSFIATLFLSGGRASEVLSLKRENFEIRQAQGVIIVRNMKLLKRYKKLESIKIDGKIHWITQSLNKTRKPFPISLKEPLTPILSNWLENTTGYLFPSPYRAVCPLTRHWAYKFIRDLDDRIPRALKSKLGLNIPFVVNGEKISDTIHLWLHFFRSQRASELVTDYGYEVLDLIDYFSWERTDTALTYARKGWRGLASKMQLSQIVYS